jgi:L(+)-tartrate dehydratase alpha subunit
LSAELEETKSRLVQILLSFIKTTAIKLPDDALIKLRELMSAESSSYGKFIYEAMMENINLALIRNAPVCQDTGILEFFVKLGENFPYKSLLLSAIKDATIEATKKGYLRPNVVDPVTGKNTGNNTGPKLPWIEVELEPNVDFADVVLYLAGGGSSRPGRAIVIDPAKGWRGLVEFVVDTIAEYGPPACPPIVVGIGVGPTAEIAASLSKKALLRPLGSRSSEPFIAKLEESLEKDLNKLNIGPQGLGGSTGVIAVHIEYAGRHPATFAVGVSTACWALRKGWIRIKSNLSYELLSHSGGLIE